MKKIIITILIIIGLLYFLAYYGVSSDQNSDCSKQFRKAKEYCSSLDECNSIIPDSVGLRYKNVSCQGNEENCRPDFACL